MNVILCIRKTQLSFISFFGIEGVVNFSSYSFNEINVKMSTVFSHALLRAMSRKQTNIFPPVESEICFVFE